MLPEEWNPDDMTPDPERRRGVWIHVPSQTPVALDADWTPEREKEARKDVVTAMSARIAERGKKPG